MERRFSALVGSQQALPNLSRPGGTPTSYFLVSWRDIRFELDASSIKGVELPVQPLFDVPISLLAKGQINIHRSNRVDDMQLGFPSAYSQYSSSSLVTLHLSLSGRPWPAPHSNNSHGINNSPTTPPSVAKLAVSKKIAWLLVFFSTGYILHY